MEMASRYFLSQYTLYLNVGIILYMQQYKDNEIDLFLLYISSEERLIILVHITPLLLQGFAFREYDKQLKRHLTEALPKNTF